MKQFPFYNILSIIKGLLLLLFCSFSLLSQDDSTVIFSKVSGIYNDNIELSLSTTQSSVIYYTLDGSVPSKKSNLYEHTIIIDTTTVVRAFAYIGTYKTKPLTRSYILERRKFSYPLISISVDPKSMFDPVKGLYSKGLNASSSAPFKGANYHKDTELPINIEYFDEVGKPQFNQLAGLKIFGAYSRMFPQKSLSIISRKSYGKKNFDYPIFPNLPYKKYKSFILRNSGSDNNRAHFRDVLMTQLVKDLSFDVQSYRTVIVFINGEYWGIYNIREKFNEHFLKQHYDLDKDSVSVMKHRSDLKMGKRHNYMKVVKFISKTDFADNKHIDSLNKLIDINNFLEYNISQTYFANTDAGGNIRYWRSWHDTARWRWLMFDTDFGFGLDGAKAYTKNTIKDFTKKSNEAWPYPAWSTLFLRGLLENDSIKNMYINKFSTYIQTFLDSTIVLNQIDGFVNRLDTEIDYQHKKWGSNRDRWNKEINRIKNFARYRPQYIFKHLKEQFELDSLINIKIEAPINGTIIFNGITINKDLKGYYFNHIDQYIKAIPNDWYVFNGWEGINIKDSVGSFKIDSSIVIKAIFNKKTRSKFFDKLKFTEFCLKCGDKEGDWIELYNNTDSIIDISSWIILRDKDKRYTIPDSTFIHSNSYILFSKDDIIIDSIYDIPSVDGLFSLKDTGLIELYTSDGLMVDSLQLDFNGKSHIELINLNLSGLNKSDWNDNKKYTPGSINASQLSNIWFNKLILFVVLPLIGLIFIISIIFVILRKRRKRPHSSTE